MLKLTHLPTMSILTSMMMPATWSASLYKSSSQNNLPTNWMALPENTKIQAFRNKSMGIIQVTASLALGHERETLPRKFPASVVAPSAYISYRATDVFYTIDFLRANHIGTGKPGKAPKQHWQVMCCAHALKLPGSKKQLQGRGGPGSIGNQQNVEVLLHPEKVSEAEIEKTLCATRV
eukprot:s1995_g18.t1